MSPLRFVIALAAAGQAPEDRTALALERCLAAPTARPRDDRQSEDQPVEEPQVDENGDPVASAAPMDDRMVCYDNARRAYDGRIVRAYRALLKRGDPESSQKLAAANQAWLNYRGTASPGAEVAAIARDHAMWLEGLLQGD